MTDTTPNPLDDQVTPEPSPDAAQPSATAASAETAGVAAEATQTVPEVTPPVATSGAEPVQQEPGTRRRAAGLAGQTAGVVGIVVSLALVVGVILGRGWLVDQVDQLAGTVDSAIGRAVTLVDTADAKATEVGDQATAAVDAAEAVIADRAASSELLQGLLAKVNGLSERYLSLRTAYAGLREDVDQLIPGFSVPQGPIDTLTAIDDRVQELDAAVMQLISAGSDRVDEAAQTIADRSRLIDQAIGGFQERLDALRGRLVGLQADVAAFADTVRTVITVGTLIIVLLLLYIAFLHLVLYRAGRGYRRPPAG
jgi:hypothetical protein